MRALTAFRILILVHAAFLASPVVACLPALPQREDGESDHEYSRRIDAYLPDLPERRRRFDDKIQIQRWEQSPRLFIGRIERVRATAPMFGKGVRQSLVRPIRWLRGGGKDGAIWVRPTLGVCGEIGGGDAVRGTVGDLFVVFAERGPLRGGSVIDSVGTSRAVPPLSDALARAARSVRGR